MDRRVDFLSSLGTIATIYSEIVFFHVMPLQNDMSLSKPLQNGLLFLFSCFTSKGHVVLKLLPSIWFFGAFRDDTK